MPRPFDHGFQAWAYDPVMSSGTFVPASGVDFVARIYVRGDQPVFATNICTVVSTGGTGAQLPVNCFMWICDSTGAVLANSSTAAQDTAWQTAGFKEMAMAGTQLLIPGNNYWIAGVIGTQSTTTVVLKGTASNAAAVNAKLGPATARFGTFGTAQVAANAITPGSISLANTAWVALS